MLVSHQKLIIDFINSLQSDEFVQWDIKKAVNKKDASFYEFRDIFIYILRNNKINLLEKLEAYFEGLSFNETDWRDLCLRDFAIIVPDKSIASAKTIYTGSFIALLAAEMDKRLDFSIINGFLQNLKVQVVSYLEQYNNELWAQAYLGLFFLRMSNKTEAVTHRGKQYRLNVANADEQQQLTIHPAFVASHQMFESDDNFITAEILPKMEKSLARCSDSVLHCYPSMFILNVVAENYRYVCLKESKMVLYKLCYLDFFAPLENISHISFSDELLNKSIKLNEVSLQISGNINALASLCFFAYERNNLQAGEVLKRYFENASNQDLYKDERAKQLIDNLHRTYRENVAKSHTSVNDLATLMSSLNQDPICLLEKFKELSTKATADLQQSKDIFKKQIFLLWCSYFQELANDFKKKDEIRELSRSAGFIDGLRDCCESIEEDIIRDQSGFKYAELFQKIADFFKNTISVAVTDEPKEILPIAKFLILSSVFGNKRRFAKTTGNQSTTEEVSHHNSAVVSSASQQQMKPS